MSASTKVESIIVVSGGAADPKIVSGTADPVAGLVAPEGTIYLRYVASAGKAYVKTGPGDTDWDQVAVGNVGNASFIWAAGRESYALDTPALVVGAFEFDKSAFAFSQIKFRAVAAKGNTVQANVELYNVTDAASVSVLNFTSNATALQQSADISGSLPAASKIYEVRIYLDSAFVSADSVELYGASLEIIP